MCSESHKLQHACGEMLVGSVLIPPNSRKTAAPEEHSVHFYADDATLIDDLRQFIGDALTRCCSAVVIATEGHNEALSRELKGRGIDLDKAITERRYLPFDAGELLSQFMDHGKIDPIEFFELVGSVLARAAKTSRGENREVVVFGETVALLWSEGNADTTIQLEKLWNGMARTRSFSLRCGYPIEGFRTQEDTDSLLKICTEHSSLIPTGFNLR